MNIKIANKIIGNNHPVFIVAEMSANHIQDFDIAVKIIQGAKKAGTDAIKLQTFTPDTTTIDCDNEYFQIKQGTIWDGQTLYELYKKAYMAWSWQPKLKKIAENEGLVCFSTPPKAFSTSLTDFTIALNSLGSKEKVASGPPNDLSKVKCFSIIEAPKATDAIGTDIPKVWSDNPTTVLKVSAKLGMVRKFTSSKGVG
ncbi:hypothetical protein ES708_22409 [subsurface metagenome]